MIRTVFAIVALGLICTNSPQVRADYSVNPLPQIVVYKSPTCGCCKAWIDHLQRSGFPVQVYDVAQMTAIKHEAKLGTGLASCHTAFVEGYAIEGHVPADDIKRLLAERPDLSGLTVPAMPVGSPGMEVEGHQAEAFDVIGYQDGKAVEIFQSYPEGSLFD